jgi:hypothetical protein
MGKNNKNYSHTVVIYPLIPVIPRHRYTVCCGVSKSTTVPVPAKPVTIPTHKQTHTRMAGTGTAKNTHGLPMQSTKLV